MRDEWFGLREKLLFKTPISNFIDECKFMRNRYAEEYNNAGEERKKEIIELISEISIDIQSYLVRWHLQNPDNKKKVVWDTIAQEVEKNYQLLITWGEEEKVKYIKKEVASIKKSNFVKFSYMADRGEINNRWGNDYGSGLTSAIRRGAVLVTTNPPIVNITRKEDAGTWDNVYDIVDIIDTQL